MTKNVPQEKSAAGNGKGALIKAIIIAGTFAAIAILSIITRGANDGSPSAGVIAARIVLLSACTVVYFGMLYYTRTSRQNEKQKPVAGKKKG